MFDFWKKKKDRQGKKPKNRALSNTGKTISPGQSRFPDNIVCVDGRFYLKTGTNQKQENKGLVGGAYSQPSAGEEEEQKSMSEPSYAPSGMQYDASKSATLKNDSLKVVVLNDTDPRIEYLRAEFGLEYSYCNLKFYYYDKGYINFHFTKILRGSLLLIAQIDGHRYLVDDGGKEGFFDICESSDIVFLFIAGLFSTRFSQRGLLDWSPVFIDEKLINKTDNNTICVVSEGDSFAACFCWESRLLPIAEHIDKTLAFRYYREYTKILSDFTSFFDSLLSQGIVDESMRTTLMFIALFEVDLDIDAQHLRTIEISKAPQAQTPAQSEGSNTAVGEGAAGRQSHQDEKPAPESKKFENGSNVSSEQSDHKSTGLKVTSLQERLEGIVSNARENIEHRSDDGKVRAWHTSPREDDLYYLFSLDPHKLNDKCKNNLRYEDAYEAYVGIMRNDGTPVLCFTTDSDGICSYDIYDREIITYEELHKYAAMASQDVVERTKNLSADSWKSFVPAVVPSDRSEPRKVNPTMPQNLYAADAALGLKTLVITQHCFSRGGGKSEVFVQLYRSKGAYRLFCAVSAPFNAPMLWRELAQENNYSIPEDSIRRFMKDGLYDCDCYDVILTEQELCYLKAAILQTLKEDELLDRRYATTIVSFSSDDGIVFCESNSK